MPSENLEAELRRSMSRRLLRNLSPVDDEVLLLNQWRFMHARRHIHRKCDDSQECDNLRQATVALNDIQSSPTITYGFVRGLGTIKPSSVGNNSLSFIARNKIRLTLLTAGAWPIGDPTRFAGVNLPHDMGQPYGAFEEWYKSTATFVTSGRKRSKVLKCKC